ncbi:hypothetical protein [Rhodoferax mekongensis]|uniref:hypothetical protein n=1 Tax=Rhodoferax mekongensis TaxID=3068341 RepID=UPI0028BD156F|nr:hypothetical protein [Rhodoferax sp. TBRC 17199]MDT7514695.1 hypothetical protein [Rhodoferax sp. TBRC 17199]
MKIELERLALYQEVWDRPFSDICVKYGLSQTQLRAACRALGIPIPTDRYWAKLATGQDAIKTPLHEDFERSTYEYVETKSRAYFVQESDIQWLEKQLTWERSPENRIAVVMLPTKWDPTLREVRKHLEAQAVKMIRQIAEHEAKKASPSKARGTWEPAWNNSSTAVEAGAFLVDKHSVTGFRVSPATFKRALAIANALAIACRSRGLKFEVQDVHGPMLISKGDASISFALRERQETITASNGVLGFSKRYVPTDKLALVVSRHPGSDLQIVDTTEIKVEDRLNEVLCCMWTQVVRSGEESRLRAHEKQEREETAKIEAEIRQRRAAEQAQTESELAKIAALLADAESFEMAGRIRAYVQAATVTIPEDLQEPFKKWKVWALKVADSKDPKKGLFETLRRGDQNS